jgi:hypothetical protein
MGLRKIRAKKHLILKNKSNQISNLREAEGVTCIGSGTGTLWPAEATATVAI